MIVALVPDDMRPMDDTQEGDRDTDPSWETIHFDPIHHPHLLHAAHSTDVKGVVKCFREPNNSFNFIEMGEVRISLERDMKTFECHLP